MKVLARVVRRWYLYLPLVLICMGAAAYYGRAKLLRYDSFSYVLVTRPAYLDGLKLNDQGSQYLSPAQNTADAINEQLASRTFSLQVAHATNLAGRYDLNSRDGQDAVITRVRADLSVAASTTGPNALLVDSKDVDGQIAQQLANSVVTLYIAYDTQAEITPEAQAESFYTDQLAAANKKAQDDGQKITDFLTSHPELKRLATQGLPVADPQYQQLEQTYTQDTDNVKHFSDTLNQIHLDQAALKAGTNQNIHVLDEATVAPKPTYEKKQLFTYVGIGLAIGLGLVAAIASLLVWIDRKIYSTTDLRDVLNEMELDVPLIETFPTVEREHRSRGAGGEASAPMSRMLMPVLAARPQSAPVMGELRAPHEPGSSGLEEHA